MDKTKTELTEVAGENSRYRILAIVENLDNEAVIPLTLKWTLIGPDRSIVNGRSRVTVVDPKSPCPIILFGKDLAIEGSEKLSSRILTIEASYIEKDGSELPYTHEYTFSIRNFIALPMTIEYLAMPADLSMPADLEMI